MDMFYARDRVLHAALDSPASHASANEPRTGRPSQWTPSSERKLCRLYLYTPLSKKEILAVLKRHDIAVNGSNSASKKLSELLDKEPRWLKPSNEEDVLRRCKQLENSPIRSGCNNYSPRSRQSSGSGHTLNGLVLPQSDIRDASLTGTTLSSGYCIAHTQDAAGLGAELLSGQRMHGDPINRSVTGDVNTIPGIGSRLSPCYTEKSDGCNQDQSLVSLDDILGEYPEPVVQAIKGIVRTYTAPASRRIPLAESYTQRHIEPDWFSDPDAAPEFVAGQRITLPGDFLNLDIRRQQQGNCVHESEQHRRRWCMCFAAKEIRNVVWITEDGPTAWAEDILNCGFSSAAPVTSRDAFGNTALHLLAARDPGMLLHVLRQGHYSTILGYKNSAGQSFLHVLSSSSLVQPQWLQEILQILAESGHENERPVDIITAQDHYGRAFYHHLLEANFPSDFLFQLLCHHIGPFVSRRDAFNSTPFSSQQDNECMMGRFQNQDSGNHYDNFVYQHSRYLEVTRLSETNPTYEDANGRNGLQCLAMATLSQRSMYIKASSKSIDIPHERNKKEAQEVLDSSMKSLSYRLTNVKALLDCGVDPNHYDHFGNTPLMAFAAELPEDDDTKLGPDILRLLISRGANIHARNRAGETALHVAARCGRKVAVKTLVEEGANVHVRDAAGRSVLEVTDAKMLTCRDDKQNDYAHLEACRAYLSGKGYAVQEPIISDEWGLPFSA